MTLPLPYFQQLATRLRADAYCLQDDEDALARATAHLEREAANAIDTLIKHCNDETEH